MNTRLTCKYSVVMLMLTALIALSSINAFAADQRGVATKPLKVDATSTPARTPGRTTKRMLKLPPAAPRYNCEDNECVCKGVLDCKDLLDSGFCKGKDFWQDGDDSSIGGCG